MKTFTKLSSDFWINYENVEVINAGVYAQLLALHLVGNAHSNSLGVYYLPIAYIGSDLRVSIKKVKNALQKLCNIGYCRYDEKTQYVWVCNMLFEQLGENIDVKDNRLKFLQTMWQALPPCLPFLEEIYQKYHEAFHLEVRSFANTEIDSTETKPTEILTPIIPTEISSNSLPEKYTSNDIKILADVVLESTKNETDCQSCEVPLFVNRDPEAPLIPLQSPSEAPSKPLRSIIDINIDKIYKNINTVNTNIITHAREGVCYEPDVNQNPPFEKTKALIPIPTSPPKSSKPKISEQEFREQATAIFEHWQKLMNRHDVTLTSDRIAHVRKAILDWGYSKEQLFDVVLGCSRTPYNMGKNKDGLLYNDFSTIFRSQEQIDRMILNCHRLPIVPLNKAQQLLCSNIAAGQNWLNRYGGCNGR